MSEFLSMELSPEEAQALLKLVYAGKLFEIQEWIASGKTVEVPSSFRKQPFTAALDQGFHSLAVVLACNLFSQDAKNAALAAAFDHRDMEFTTMLLDFGADLHAVPLSTVLGTWDQRLMRLFLARDADAITGTPFAHAFEQRVQQALRVFVEYKEDHPELADALQEQVDAALRHACSKSDLKWVSLLLWAGANPRSVGDDGSTAFEDASYAEDPAILKRLKPDPKRDDLGALLVHAARFAHHKTVEYLLNLGAPINNKPNGGSAALDGCLERLHFADFDAILHRRPISRYAIWKIDDTLKLLLDRGALWQPEAEDLKSLRRTLYKADPELTLEVVKRLRKPATMAAPKLWFNTSACKNTLQVISTSFSTSAWTSVRRRTKQQWKGRQRSIDSMNSSALLSTTTASNSTKMYGPLRSGNSPSDSSVLTLLWPSCVVSSRFHCQGAAIGQRKQRENLSGAVLHYRQSHK